MPSQHNLGGSAAASLLELDNIPFPTFMRYIKLLRAGQVVVDFNIKLEKNRVIFYGPPNKNNSRTVRGKVRLEVAGKLHVKEIMITLSGEFHIINNENSNLISDEPPRQGTIFSTCILLANKRVLTPGEHELYFEFLLPGDLPESMSSDLILCEYFLKAELVPRCSEDLQASQNKLVDVVDLTVQRAMLQSDEHIKQGLCATRYTGSRDKILDYEFVVPKIMKLNAGTFTFHARWDGLRVDNIKLWLVQTEGFKSLQSEDSFQESLVDPDRKSKVLSGPFHFDMPKKEPLKLQSRPMTFQLPITEFLVGDYEANNVEIRHKLIVYIQMANKNKEIIPLSVPITIESIVADTEMIPPPCRVHCTDSIAYFHFANKIYFSRSLEDNNNQQRSYSLKRFIQAERRKNTTMVDHSTESTTIVTSSQNDSIRTTPLQFSRRSSSVVRNRTSSNNNVKNSISTIIESASEYTNDESSNENSHTIATTATYTNNTEHEKTTQGFPQKKPTFVINSGNMIASKFNHLLNRNRSVKNKFAPGLIGAISNRNPNANNINTSLTT